MNDDQQSGAAGTAPDVRHVDAAQSFEPTAHYAELRERCPVHRVDEHDPPFYVLSRFDDILAVLKQPHQWRNGDGPGVFYQERGVLGTTDEPDHGRHRRVLRAALAPVAIAPLEDRIRLITDQLIDEFVADGRCEFVERFAAPLPALAIAELLGVHGEDRESFGRLSTVAVDALTGGDVGRYHEAKGLLEDHVERGCDARLAAFEADGEVPDDVLSVLMHARRTGTIDTTEARHMGYQLLVAGHETTTSLIGMLLYRAIERPELMAALRADPSLIPAAIEEELRFDSPVHGLFRTNPDEAEIAGTTIPARAKVQLAYAAANRDPSMFSEPDTFRLDRDRHEIGHHLAFGWGIHLCIGAPLARLETRIAFERLLARLDDITLDGEPERNRSFVLHGLTSLPIRFRAVAA